MSNLVLNRAGAKGRGYTFEDTGIEIFSYEELCYYICQNPVLFVEEWCTFSLLNWISKELQMEEMARQMNGYSQNSSLQVSVILSYGDYMNRRKAESVLEEIQGMQKGSRIQFHKKKGDCYLTYGKFFRARKEYRQLLKQEHLIPDKIFLGNIYHNMATTYLMDRDIEEGKEYARKAFANNPNKDTCFQYLLLIYLEGGESQVKEAATELGLSMEVQLSFLEKITQQRKQIQNYDKKIEYMLEQWKKQYRMETT